MDLKQKYNCFSRLFYSFTCMAKVSDEWVSSVFLALGTNVGDSVVLLRQAVEQISSCEEIDLIAQSDLYRTKAWVNQKLNDFYNMVVELKTKLSPHELLEFCLQTEKSLGRKRKETDDYENRPIDIDIIFYEHYSCQTETLQLPHPYWSSRRFVLEPLAELAANFFPHNGNKSIAEFLRACPDKLRVEKIK
jgi:2-amino-4-hydroxy-6-hydroxymethyldihydropteridine diphosphokinase